MYVCLCNGVTEHDIRHAASSGCRTLAELTMRTGCGSTCGSCLEMAATLLAETSPPPDGANAEGLRHAFTPPPQQLLQAT